MLNRLYSRCIIVSNTTPSTVLLLCFSSRSSYSRFLIGAQQLRDLFAAGFLDETTMADWQQLVQSVVLGLIFSYLLAKLISVLVSFKEDNLFITRDADSQPPAAYSRVETSEPKDRGGEAHGSGSHDTDSIIAEHGSVRNESLVQSEDDDGSDSDWEGVESTELDEAFSAATAFVAAAASDRLSQRVSNDVQLQLYGLYKIATEGPCTTSQPSALKMTARAKWQAWNKLGAMPPEAAMEKYIDIVTELYPTWLSGSSVKSRGGGSNAEAHGPMGPVFSTFVYEESGDESKMDAIHGYAREGDVSNLLKSIKNDVPVDVKDSEGRTPLHWAVDRGHLEVAELLLGNNADINAKDNDGQTALHYAVVCDREGIAEFLVKQNASIDIKDNDGSSPSDVCNADWSFMSRAK